MKEKIPSFITRLDSKKEQDISFDERDKMMKFNTAIYWWCYFDPKTKKLYDQYCHLIIDDAVDYLTSLGHINSDMNKIKEFS